MMGDNDQIQFQIWIDESSDMEEKKTLVEQYVAVLDDIKNAHEGISIKAEIRIMKY